MASDFGATLELLRGAVSERSFPCAVAEVGTSTGATWTTAVGRLTDQPEAAEASLDTVFDLASLTKVIATTSLAMRAVEASAMSLDDRVSRWIRHWRGADREAATVRDLLAHTSGLTAHLPFFRDCVGREEFQPAIASTALEYAPRSRAVYSDLGFMLLGFLLEDAAGAGLDAQFGELAAALPLGDIRFRAPATWKPRMAPTGTSEWRGRSLIGEVHDDNCWALGGVAGHAGLFGTAAAVGRFARILLADLRSGAPTRLASPGTLRQFVTRDRVAGSSRALGWDTMLPRSSCGPLMSPSAIGHTGFTGTSLWIDWERDAYFVLLTNRVYPDASNDAILGIRRQFHSLAIAALGLA
jgi:CubicO group peptidase (beta-lactamase class C family)